MGASARVLLIRTGRAGTKFWRLASEQSRPGQKLLFLLVPLLSFLPLEELVATLLPLLMGLHTIIAVVLAWLWYRWQPGGVAAIFRAVCPSFRDACILFGGSPDPRRRWPLKASGGSPLKKPEKQRSCKCSRVDFFGSSEATSSRG